MYFRERTKIGNRVCMEVTQKNNQKIKKDDKKC